MKPFRVHFNLFLIRTKLTKNDFDVIAADVVVKLAPTSQTMMIYLYLNDSTGSSFIDHPSQTHTSLL